MSVLAVDPISSVIPASDSQGLQKANAPQVASQPAAISSHIDIVTLSPAAQKAAPSGDTDRDGDSR